MKATCSYIQNYYYNCPNLWNTSNSQYADAHDDVAMETVDPQFIDAASGNLTIGNQTVKIWQSEIHAGIKQRIRLNSHIKLLLQKGLSSIGAPPSSFRRPVSRANSSSQVWQALPINK